MTRDYCTACGEDIRRTLEGWAHEANPWHSGAELDAHHKVQAIEDYS